MNTVVARSEGTRNFDKGATPEPGLVERVGLDTLGRVEVNGFHLIAVGWSLEAKGSIHPRFDDFEVARPAQ